jgi:S-methylmethionine-dependent homocysteine/selenocysteine methylase
MIAMPGRRDGSLGTTICAETTARPGCRRESSQIIHRMGKFAELPARGGTVVLDGAGGTELERRGYLDRRRLWSAGAIEDAPELVVRIHRDYIDAGAQVITTQTFTCCRRRFAKAGAEALFEPLTRRGVALAIDALHRSVSSEISQRPQAAVEGGSEGAERRASRDPPGPLSRRQKRWGSE